MQDERNTAWILDKFVLVLKLLEFFNLPCSISHFVHLYEKIVSLYG